MTMMDWDSRMRDNHSVQVLKAVIPFFDVAVGERIDMEGLLSAVRPFTRGRERRFLDIFLQFFQMQRMMEMMQMVQSMQQFAEATEGQNQNGSGASPAMFEMLKSMIPPEQQDMVDMMSAMMAMSETPDMTQGTGYGSEPVSEPETPEDEQKEGDHEPVDL